MNYPANCLCRFYAAYAVACWHHPIHTWQHVGNHSCTANHGRTSLHAAGAAPVPNGNVRGHFGFQAGNQRRCRPLAPRMQCLPSTPNPYAILPAGIAPESASAASQIPVFMPICVSLYGSPTPIRHFTTTSGRLVPGDLQCNLCHGAR